MPSDADAAVQKYLDSLSTRESARLQLVFMGLAWGQEHGHKGHMKAGQLVSAIADAAEDRWGLMAHVVLEHYGAGTSVDIGAIVADLLEHGLLRADDRDRQSDFDDGPDLAARFDPALYRWKVPEALDAALQPRKLKV